MRATPATRAAIQDASSDRTRPRRAATTRDISITRLRDEIVSLATAPGHIATALPDLWFFRLDQSASFPRAHSPVMNLAVAISGRKTIRTGGHSEVNDPSRFLVMCGDVRYQAKVEASGGEPYIALKLQLPPEMVGRTLLELADAGVETPARRPPAAFSDALSPELAQPLLRLLSCLRDPAERRIVAPL